MKVHLIKVTTLKRLKTLNYLLDLGNSGLGGLVSDSLDSFFSPRKQQEENGELFLGGKACFLLFEG